MSKGSKPRPFTNKAVYDQNYDTIFGRKYTAKEADYELCPYCGIRAEEVCDSPPPDMCDKAVYTIHGQWLKDLNENKS